MGHETTRDTYCLVSSCTSREHAQTGSITVTLVLAVHVTVQRRRAMTTCDFQGFPCKSSLSNVKSSHFLVPKLHYSSPYTFRSPIADMSQQACSVFAMILHFFLSLGSSSANPNLPCKAAGREIVPRTGAVKSTWSRQITSRSSLFFWSWRLACNGGNTDERELAGFASLFSTFRKDF